ncbi:MAG: hypothetical protein WBE71_25090, partial [Xanthobacteraceae bacterium]
PVDLFAPTPKSCRNGSATSRFRRLYSCGERGNRSDAGLRYRRIRVPSRRLYHGFDREFFFTAFGFVIALDVIMQQPLDAPAAE